MTTNDKLIKTKLGLLNLAVQLRNVSQACRTIGYSRDSYYRIKELYETGGEAALQEVSKRKPNHKNRVDPYIEEQVVAIAYEYPAYGQVRASNELAKKGITVSAGGIRSIWLRNDLESFKKRLKSLEAKVAKEGGILTEAQLQALEKAREEKVAKGEIETQHPGYLGSQDTYYVGNVKGVGRIYQQTYIDTYCKVAQAKLYSNKDALTAADLLNDKVLPMYEEQDVRLLRILTDRGTEYCGKIEKHPYQLYLDLEDIDHTRTKAKSPQTNGICERFHRTIQDEFYAVVFRKKIFRSIYELQIELDAWLEWYNRQRTHSGKHCNGKTPWDTFMESKHLALEKQLDRLPWREDKDRSSGNPLLSSKPEGLVEERDLGSRDLEGEINLTDKNQL
ncbi:IS481 family transposase (plasmid) [Chondrinema litorale]|nr:IS481 family transposase [Chondrinema litorale]UZS00039.1 IS481 family transposase [Chondrinema litorale]